MLYMFVYSACLMCMCVQVCAQSCVIYMWFVCVIFIAFIFIACLILLDFRCGTNSWPDACGDHTNTCWSLWCRNWHQLSKRCRLFYYRALWFMLITSGADGGLDFQCIRVGDEAKQSIQLKNKGKYDIEYKYALCTDSLYVAYMCTHTCTWMLICSHIVYWLIVLFFKG